MPHASPNPSQHPAIRSTSYQHIDFQLSPNHQYVVTPSSNGSKGVGYVPTDSTKLDQLAALGHLRSYLLTACSHILRKAVTNNPEGSCWGPVQAGQPPELNQLPGQRWLAVL